MGRLVFLTGLAGYFIFGGQPGIGVAEVAVYILALGYVAAFVAVNAGPRRVAQGSRCVGEQLLPYLSPFAPRDGSEAFVPAPPISSGRGMSEEEVRQMFDAPARGTDRIAR